MAEDQKRLMQTKLFENIKTEEDSEKEVSHKAKSYKGLYAMHKYWGKKPYNIMADFVKKYTNEGEIVLDPFCGSGVSISEALFNGRKAIGIDINPSSILITKNVIKTIDSGKAIREFQRIEAVVKDEIQALYHVERNGQIYDGQNFLWEQGKLTEIRYSNGTRKKQITTPNSKDVERASKITYESIALYFPKQHFLHNSRINASREKQISDLFTPRNLYALSLIFAEIEKINEVNLRDFFKFCFTASIGQASKMVFVIKRRNKTKENGATEHIKKKEVGSWVIGYWMPKDFFENNSWTCFENRFKKILKAKKEQEKLEQNFCEAENFDALNHNKDFLLVKQPAQDYLKRFPENSIDYILTDPPHGNRIPYLELSLMWNSWLKEEADFEKEVVVSESKDRNKNKVDYNKLMSQVFAESFRVLKPKGHLSFMFNSLDDDAWINSIKMFRNIGFRLQTIETLAYSANSVVQDNRKNGLKTDFIITYSKPSQPYPVRELDIVKISKDTKLKDKIAIQKKQGYQPFEIMNSVIKELLEKDKFLNVSELIKTIEDA